VKVELKKADPAEVVASRRELMATPFLRALGAQATPTLQQGTLRRYPDKAVLMQQNEEGQSLFFVLNGDVRLFARRDKDSAELGVAHAGEVLGEAEVLSGAAKRACSAVAQGPVDVLELPREALLSNGKLPQGLAALLGDVQTKRTKALDEMSDFLNRW
jgi:CRP-like cAMP-binding protein